MESQTLEWKESWHDQHLRIISGFANCKGGKMVIGVDDNGDVVGLKNAKKLQEDIPNKVNDILQLIVECELVKHDDKETLEISIEASKQLIPYKARYYKRAGSTTLELQGAQLREAMYDAEGKTWDAIEETRVDFDCLDMFALEHFRKVAVKNGKYKKEDLSIPDKDLLQKLELLTEDGKLTRAAVLLFGENPNFYYRDTHVKVGYFRMNGEFDYDDELTGPLFSIAAQVMKLIETRYFKNVVTYRDSIFRIDNCPVYVPAFREALYNAMMHSDYCEGGHLLVKVFDHQVTINNTGGLPHGWTVEKLQKAQRSIPRNKLVAETFHKAGLVERWGRGLSNIRKGCLEANYPEPIIEGDNLSVHIVFPTLELTRGVGPETVVIGGPAQQPVVEQQSKPELTKRQYKILEILNDYPTITTQTLAKELEVTTRTLDREFKTLKEKEVLQRFGSNKDGRWVVLLGEIFKPSFDDMINEPVNVGEKSLKIKEKSDSFMSNDKKDVGVNVGEKSLKIKEKSDSFMSNDKKDGPVNGCNHLEEEILKMVEKEPALPTRAIATKLNKSASTVNRAIKSLVSEKKLIREGGRKYGYWKVL